jgi:hypothetical protein
MKKLGLGLVIVSALLLVVATPPTSQAQGPVDPRGVSAWTAEYFNNIALTGSPAFARDDATIDFFWREGTSPVPGYVNVNNYSVRWTRSINFTSAGKWTFHFVADDGVRLWVDNNLVIDAWIDQAPTPHIGTISLTAGWHNVRVEYYNKTLGGTAKLNYWGDVAYSDWKAEYFANQTLAGAPMFIRNDPNIDFNWDAGSPEVRIPVDHFSVRWTRTIHLDAGRWRFSTTTDDGVRVWVNNYLLIDKWIDQAPTTHSSEIDLNLPSGEYAIKVEYYENTGGAMAKLALSLVTPPGEVWRGQYFNNASLSGVPSFVRDDLNINFEWEMGSPGAPLPPDNFSVRWESRRQFPGGFHQFSITSDDGARVWVDGSLLIDAWYDRPPSTSSAGRSLAPGPHDVRVEYYERGGNASVNLKIMLEAPPPVGEVVVDDRGAGWTMGGPAAYWHTTNAGIGGRSLWTYNNTYTMPSYNWARWTPPLRHAGNYEVFAYIPRGLGTTLTARYWVYHNNRYDSAIRNQGLYADQWMSLGTHYFHAQGGENVSLSDVTYECYLCRTLVFDAVKFVPR